MATTIEMPRMDMEMQEGTVVRWLKAEGDAVAQGEVIAEIETDKAIVEVEAPTGGVLRQIAVEEGTTTPVGSVLGIITAPDEEMPTPDSLRTSSTETQRDTLSDDEQSIPLSSMRRVIAARTSRSVHEAPHFYVTAEIDMTRATEFRREFNDTSAPRRPSQHQRPHHQGMRHGHQEISQRQLPLSGQPPHYQPPCQHRHRRGPGSGPHHTRHTQLPRPRPGKHSPGKQRPYSPCPRRDPQAR